MNTLQILRQSKICIVGLLVFIPLVAGCAPVTTVPTVAEAEILKSSGETMGTYYVVTIADPPTTLPSDWAEQVDRELRLVNDQMSTYLKSSEISRFNASTSTDWFEVSTDLANVVQAGLDISQITDGAFDVTVAPLVNAWNFGPAKRSTRPPSDEEINGVLKSIGYEKLSVRLDPPALRKEIPTLTIDLSAIAKGHGVDRLVDLLRGHGCENVFVDIGGEDRAIGKRGDREWRVAIEDPNDKEREYHLAFALDNQAIATSGDYRNFFEFEGKRYSHTIDPRTGRPVTNQVASVSVFANDCMTADGWATALTVLGPESGIQLAESLKLPVRVVTRSEEGTFTVSMSSLFPKEIDSKPQG